MGLRKAAIAQCIITIRVAITVVTRKTMRILTMTARISKHNQKRIPIIIRVPRENANVVGITSNLVENVRNAI